MNINQISTDIQQWVYAHSGELIISFIVLVLYMVSRKIIKRLVNKHATKNGFDKSRVLYITKITGAANTTVFAVLLGLTWEISLSGLSFYFASIFTVVGVALFAHWSILSNLTASVILYFFFPYKIGSKIRIQDGDNSVEGLILDIKMFYLHIEMEDGRKATYPNNLALQKASFSQI